MLFVLVVVIFVVTVLFKLGPAYMSYMTMKSIMNGVAESPEPILGGKAAIMKVLENRMMVNEVRTIDSKSFAFKKVGEEAFGVTLTYERREHLFFNVDAVLTFSHSVVVKGR
ncbi:DUF4845 domain-containing protein [uncultured Thiodictyon sp.]|uniref:DUF4845 domain-containing protein n=1 Tax=uncultured Thiodictyon sp. TaxID=1846217 RepID=UPI0025FA328A|nr:DUF4845 domain-containing protein [uncultured Thiodictyon sp.]